MLIDQRSEIGAMTVDAAKGSDTPFDDRIHAVRGQKGQRAVAARYRAWLKDSPLRASHIDCEKVQDPYCLRCQPQVVGACLDQLRHAALVLLREANAVTDNPLVFAAEGGLPALAAYSSRNSAGVAAVAPSTVPMARMDTSTRRRYR